MPEDDNMTIILGRPFLNTAGDVIDCNKSKVTFHINVIQKSPTITIGSFQLPLHTVKKKYEMLIVGDIHIPVEVT